MSDAHHQAVQNRSVSSSAGDLDDRLEVYRREIALTVHDVNNPLAIISGNAQLLAEMARMLDLDEDLSKSIADIEQAAQELAQRLSRLSALQENGVTIGD